MIRFILFYFIGRVCQMFATSLNTMRFILVLNLTFPIHIGPNCLTIWSGPAQSTGKEKYIDSISGDG